MLFQRKERPVRFALVLIGLLFFANPYFAAIDVLPDFIGCALIYLGLSRVASVNRSMSEARTVFFKLMLYCLAKDIAVLAVFTMFAQAERPVALLSITFVNALATLYLSYHALRALFDGFLSLSRSYECEALYASHERRPSRTERIFRSTMLFFVLREIFCTLPEFAALSTSDYFDSGLIYLYDYIGVMRFLAGSPVVIFSIFWIVSLARYFRTVSKQRDFRRALGEKSFAFLREHPGVVITRRYSISFLLISIGAFFLCDFYLDMKNILPDWVGAFLILLGILCTDLSVYKKALGCCASMLFCGASLVSTSYSEYFALYHSAVEISKTDAARLAYQNMWHSALVEFFLFLVLVVCLLLLLRSVIRRWAGYVPIQQDLEFEKRRRLSFLEEFDKELLRVFFFGFISGVVSFLNDYIQQFPNKRIFRILEFMWGIDLVFGLIFAVMLCVTLSNIQKQIVYRFSFDA